MTVGPESTKENRKVLDAFAFLVWIQRAPGGKAVRGMLEQASGGQAELFVSSINAGEVFYCLVRQLGPKTASQFLSDLHASVIPVKIAVATNYRVWDAARIKAEHRLSFADAFAVGLARELNAELVTGDPEILGVARAGIVRVNALQ